MKVGVLEKSYLTKVEVSESLSSGMRWGFVCIGFFLALAFAHFANTARLPALESLSQHEITPVNFGMMQLSFKNKQNTDTALPPKDLGYVYVVPSQSLPNRCDKSSPPELTEVSGSITPNTKDLRFHAAANVTEMDAVRLAELVGKPLIAWFYQGKIVVLGSSGQFVADSWSLVLPQIQTNSSPAIGGAFGTRAINASKASRFPRSRRV